MSWRLVRYNDTFADGKDFFFIADDSFFAGPEEIMEKAAQDEEALDVEAAKALLHSSLSKSHHDAK
jgi:hypothetical protein